MHKKVIPIFLTVLILSILVSGTLSPSDKHKNKKKKELNERKGPVDKSVFDRGLVEDEPSPTDILVENGAYFKDTSKRVFQGTSLGYITPVSNGRKVQKDAEYVQ